MAETKAGHVLVAQVPAGTGAAPHNGVPRMLELGLALSVQGSTRPSEGQLPNKCSASGLGILGLWAPQRERLCVLSADGAKWAKSCLGYL